METIFLTLKRFFVRLSRFHCRCGYGVHSPFAFDFISQVICEKKPYTVYKELKVEEQKQMRVNPEKGGVNESRKVNRLLFRLVNRMQPCTIVDVGNLSCPALYLQADKPSADYVPASDLTDLFLEKEVPVDFLYLQDYKNPALTEQIFRVCVARSRKQSVFVIRGVGYSKEMKTLWRRLIANEEVGITFDLYDLGILFFDKSKVKQHYKVRF
ncbi:hypothetical protein EZS27_005978 [termite gut metagenome]|uniref:Uncharacterized protein n=1 Tax=termite gut metagenome TaxID=433724 RepID=A0A5J4SKC5_9ZZZZ